MVEEVQARPGSHLPLSHILDLIAKFSFSFVGLSYIFGFIIVNSYLGIFGLVNISFFKTKYVAAGAVFILFLSISGIILYPVALFRSVRKPKIGMGEAISSIGSLFVLYYLFYRIAPEVIYNRPFSTGLLPIILLTSLGLVIVAVLFKRLSKLRVPLSCVAMGILIYQTFDPRIFWLLIGLIILAMFTGNFISDLSKLRSKEMSLSGMALNTTIVVSLFLGLCTMYGRYLYPKIENEYGGGKPLFVTLLLTEDENPALKSLLADETNSSEKIEGVTLIDEDEVYFYIQKDISKQIETIRIRKSIVNAVLYPKSVKDQSGPFGWW